jgi:hypothetical protein
MSEGAKALDEAGTITVTAILREDGQPVETIKVEYEGDINHPGLAQRLASVLEFEAEELLAEFSENPECYRHEERHCHINVTCVDVHFESVSAKRRFLARSKWERVHQWGCREFKVAHNACPNLELRDGGPEGPVLNEDRRIGHHKGCREVWLVKPGPEPNGV